MNQKALRLYHALPSECRSAVAALRGLQLRWWRYGGDSLQLVEQALERDHWSAEAWCSWREERLAFVLHRGATSVPYYREHWRQRRLRGDGSAWDQLENWPILEKAVVRNCPEAFVADDCDRSKMYREHTSGTTGTPLSLWWSRKTVRGWFALMDARLRRWNGFTRADRWAILGGQLVIPPAQNRPPFWVWNPALRQLYLSSFHISGGTAAKYAEAIKRYGVRYLLGYSSSLHLLAQEFLRLGIRGLPVEAVITNAEPLFDYQRLVIQEAFACPVRETYGMAEIVGAASECSGGRMHWWPETGHMEMIKADLSDGARTGALVCTSLLNEDMPLIRYSVGDSITLPVADGPCECGRGLPAVAAIHGRTSDMLIARDGRKVYWLNPVLYELPVREAQIVQESYDRIRVRYAPAIGFGEHTKRSIEERLRTRLGPVDLVFEEVESIPRDAAGKFRPVVCRVAA